MNIYQVALSLELSFQSSLQTLYLAIVVLSVKDEIEYTVTKRA